MAEIIVITMGMELFGRASDHRPDGDEARYQYLLRSGNDEGLASRASTHGTLARTPSTRLGGLATRRVSRPCLSAVSARCLVAELQPGQGSYVVP
jgi:hypothetical protein